MASRKPPTEPSPVGRGRPPRGTQFKPGQSGNPGGRPRKERSFAKLVDGELDVTVTVTENGKSVKLTKREIAVRTLVNAAVRGDFKAFDRMIQLVGASSSAESALISVDPQIIVSFLAQVAGHDGEKSE